MGKKLKAAKAARAAKVERIEDAHQHIWDAINDINQSGLSMHMSQVLRQLYDIEDVLWQYATERR